mmetsp:Transcript_13904/g.25615  ORF Transcript_13904/g.25615 Transcript_13904/m.25615 type:complete len:677 (+) Transcript_13904:96-2126(+)
MASPSRTGGQQSKSIGHYILMKTIGEGTFGKVKLGTHILTGERVAVKVLEKERIVDAADVGRVAREIHILKLIRHSHIIQLYEIIETPRQLYLIMEYASGGELFDYIVCHGRAQEPEACRFLHQILAGVEKVHNMRVVHRDLKPENLLLDDRKDIKIVDFGLSNTYQENQLLNTACGSPCYAAPEMIAGKAYHPPMVDIWSCGVILFALVCGYLPFEDQNHAKLYEKILSADYEVPDFISEDVTDLIAAMLTTDPDKRITLAGIRQHRWYQQIPEASLPDISGHWGLGSTNKATAPKWRKTNSPAIILDEEILEQLESYGFSREYATKCLHTNKHNHVTTTYYLLLSKKQRSSSDGTTPASHALADLEAQCFDAFNSEPEAMEPAVAMVATPSRAVRHEAMAAGGDVPERRSWSWARSPRDAETGRARQTNGTVGVPKLDFNSAFPKEGSGIRLSNKSPEDLADAMDVAVPTRRPQTARGEHPPAPGSARRATSPWNAGIAPYRAQRGERVSYSGTGGYSPREPPVMMPLTARPRMQAMDASSWDGSRGAPAYGTSRGQPRHASCGPSAAVRVRRSTGNVDGACSTRQAGGMNISCSSQLPPHAVMAEVVRALALQQIPCRQVSTRMLRCQTAGVRIEVNVSYSAGGGTMLRLVQVAGDPGHYRDVCAQLVSELQL